MDTAVKYAVFVSWKNTKATKMDTIVKYAVFVSWKNTLDTPVLKRMQCQGKPMS